MSGAALIVFAASFVLGPLICVGLLRLPNSMPVLVALAVTVTMTMIVALVLQAGLPLASLVVLWLGWLSAVAMVGHALRRKITGRKAQRWITVAALLAAPLPWFGLATAQAMA